MRWDLFDEKRISFPSLRKLNLSGVGLDTGAAERLAEGLTQLRNLKDLSVRDNSICVNGLLMLEDAIICSSKMLVVHWDSVEALICSTPLSRQTVSAVEGGFSACDRSGTLGRGFHDLISRQLSDLRKWQGIMTNIMQISKHFITMIWLCGSSRENLSALTFQKLVCVCVCMCVCVCVCNLPSFVSLKERR